MHIVDKIDKYLNESKDIEAKIIDAHGLPEINNKLYYKETKDYWIGVIFNSKIKKYFGLDSSDNVFDTNNKNKMEKWVEDTSGIKLKLKG